MEKIELPKGELSILHTRLHNFKVYNFSAIECCIGSAVEQYYNLPPAWAWNNCKNVLNIVEEVKKQINEKYKTEIKLRVLSIYRDDFINTKVGGAPCSQHKKFRAVDFAPYYIGAKPMQLGKLVKEVKNIVFDYWLQYGESEHIGIGFFKNFIHIDTKACRRWGEAKDYEAPGIVEEAVDEMDDVNEHFEADLHGVLHDEYKHHEHEGFVHDINYKY